MKVLIVHDKLSDTPTPDELDTMDEVNQVYDALLSLGHTVRRLAFDSNLNSTKQAIMSSKADVVFNLVETLEGSSLLHIPPALYESMGVRYTGGNSMGMLRSSDKLHAKQLMRASGIMTPEWISSGYDEHIAALVDVPVIVKPIHEEASVGIDDTSIKRFDSVPSLRQFILENQNRMFVERYIDGREFNISILSKAGTVEVLPIAEMKFIEYPVHKPKIVGYAAKWEETSWEYHHTVRDFSVQNEEPTLIDRLQSVSLACWTLFGAKGYARVDIRIDASGGIWVLEVNLNPCISNDSGFIAAAREAGYSYTDVIATLIEE